uniref:Uncharacterized protein n=1 Tax=viral metagenome TaxID=1070528 RepID=A0A6M3IH21_9ZZZZ
MGQNRDRQKIFTKFVEGKTSFLSKGFAEIKITTVVGETQDDAQEKSEIIYLPIRSTGIVELQELLRTEAPQPPRKTVKIKKGDEFDITFGLEPGELASVWDVTEDSYLKEFENYQNNFMWRTVIQALDVTWEDTEGKPITDFESKKKILINTGITGHHLDQIFLAIQRLTSEREEAADFLSGKKLGLQRRF